MNCEGERREVKNGKIGPMVQCSDVAITQRTFKDSMKFVDNGEGGTVLIKFDETQNFCEECAVEYDEAMTFRLLEATI
jgi:hypothetical protein